jgi:hypothetical protein
MMNDAWWMMNDLLNERWMMKDDDFPWDLDLLKDEWKIYWKMKDENSP